MGNSGRVWAQAGAELGCQQVAGGAGWRAGRVAAPVTQKVFGYSTRQVYGLELVWALVMDAVQKLPRVWSRGLQRKDPLLG